MRERISVDAATILEWPQIESLRRAYFAARGESVQRRDDATRWVVARRGERVLACASYGESVDVEGRPWRWYHDFYALPSRDGKRGLLAIHHWTDEAILGGLRVGTTVAPDNMPQFNAERRHGYRLVGLIMVKEPD